MQSEGHHSTGSLCSPSEQQGDPCFNRLRPHPAQEPSLLPAQSLMAAALLTDPELKQVRGVPLLYVWAATLVWERGALEERGAIRIHTGRGHPDYTKCSGGRQRPVVSQAGFPLVHLWPQTGLVNILVFKQLSGLRPASSAWNSNAEPSPFMSQHFKPLWSEWRDCLTAEERLSLRLFLILCFVMNVFFHSPKLNSIQIKLIKILLLYV